MTKPTKKIPKTFISFLIISFFIWLLITFSKEYTTIITYSLVYKNIDQNKLLQEIPVKEIDFSVKSTGFKLLRAKLRSKKINLEASNLKYKKGSKYYFLPKNQTTKIQRQLLSGVVLQEILKDTIYLNLGILASKKVALKPNLEIDYHIGYDLLEEISITPDSIIISGPESQLKNINYLNVSKLVLKDVKANFKNEVNVEKVGKKNNIKTTITKATIIGKVDKFTEGTLQVPYTITNLPENLNVGGSLNIINTNITCLPENLSVGGSLYLSNTNITSLPCNLKVGDDLYLIHTKIENLPDNLSIGGSIYR